MMSQVLENPATTRTITDEELMQGILDREHTALDQLYHRYRLLLTRIIGQVLLSQADVEETVQDVFLEIWKRADNFDLSKGKPLGWIICMARRRALDHQRKVRRHAKINEMLHDSSTEGYWMIAAGFGGGSASDDQPATATDLLGLLTDIIDDLPTEQRHVVYQTYFQDLSQRQIATSTGVPLSTVKTRLLLARRKLSQRSAHLRENLC